MKIDIVLDASKTVVIGFHAGGWQKLVTKLGEESKTVYTTSNRLFDRSNSIYWQHHAPSTIAQKAAGKTKSIDSVQSALDTFKEHFRKIQSPQSRNEIFNLIIDSMGIEQTEEEIQTILKEIEQATEPNQKLLETLIDYTKDYDDQLEDKDHKKIIMPGYSLAQFFRSVESLNGILIDDKPLKLLLTEWASYTNLRTSDVETQNLLALSKSMIVDAIQQNLNLLNNGQPLIPVYVVTGSEKPGSMFTPLWDRTIQKSDSAYTSAEIRMVYKLMEEIDSSLIKDIMKKTVIFVKHTQNGFEAIPAPWDTPDKSTSDHIAISWNTRPRGRNKDKESHKDRDIETRQEWMNQLELLADTVAIKLERQDSQQKDSPQKPRL